MLLDSNLSRVDADGPNGLPECLVHHSSTVPAIHLLQSRRHRLQGILRKTIHDAVDDSLRSYIICKGVHGGGGGGGSQPVGDL